jgi:hypothetical protein
MTEEQKRAILECIRFYAENGWDWGDVVCYLSLKYTGRLERFMNPYRTRVGT